MAKRTVTTLLDDIDGSEATETVTYGIDGATYEIDLNDDHASELREFLAPYVSVSRRLGRPAGRQRSRNARVSSPGPVAVTVSGKPDPRVVRAWAEENGIAVSERGRLGKDVLEKYRAATA